jgi:phage terminase large subunit GpA-like protein
MTGALAQYLADQPALRDVLKTVLQAGLAAFGVPEPMRASQWADKYFYLSAESSYREGEWSTWPFQRAILDCMGHDRIVSVTVRKPARVGYTKMLLAANGYFAAHKRRNVIVYQPTDSDAEDFVKGELDPVLRDVKAMRAVFPAFLRRSKDNTLRTKRFLGSSTHVRGGTSSKNYRRLTADVVILDELDGFDRDIDKEGSPIRLSFKRLEGATYPKHIKGSTPKTRGSSLTDEEFEAADHKFEFHVPCPHCKHEQPLRWGGKTARSGFKWVEGKPETVVHICEACGVGFTQAEYLQVWQFGRWMTVDGIWIDPECRFFTRGGQELPPPRSVAFTLWTAYSPQATWQWIVEERIEAERLKRKGDDTALKAWTNTTLGQSYKAEGTSTSAEILKQRSQQERYRLRLVPRGGLVLTAGVDVQDNRLHALVWAWGRDDESWLVDRRVFWSDPGAMATWMSLDTYLMTRFPHESGRSLAIDSVAIDTGGHFTHQVYRYCMLRDTRRVHATRGATQANRPIVAGAPTKQDVSADGQLIKDGVKLWHVGTDTAKDLLLNRLRLAQPGPGYVHVSHEVEPDFFTQITNEHRIDVRTARGVASRWEKVTSGARQEDLDCTVLAMFCAARMKLGQYTDAEWSQLERALYPPTADLFGGGVPIAAPEPLPPWPSAPGIQVEPAEASPVLAKAPADADEPPAAPAAAPIVPMLPQPAILPAPRTRRVRGVLT